MTPEKIAVLGAGSWGSTLATVLSENGHSVSLWEINEAAAKEIQATRRLRVLPDLRVPSAIHLTSSIAEAVTGAQLIVAATPSQFMRSTMKTLSKALAGKEVAPIINVAKGLEESTQKRMSEIIAEELSLSDQRIVVLSGPSHAEEVCRKFPTALVSACSDVRLAERVQKSFGNDYLRVYTHTDKTGVELGGTLKNVLAIACGISDGLGLGDNSKAAIMTRGLSEMARIGMGMGAELHTFYGLAGMGDLIVTCLSRHSRNRSFGEKIGTGRTPEMALKEMTMVVEGYKTSSAAWALVERFKLDCPLFREIHLVLNTGKSPKQSLSDLMKRESHTE